MCDLVRVAVVVRACTTTARVWLNFGSRSSLARFEMAAVYTLEQRNRAHLSCSHEQTQRVTLFVVDERLTTLLATTYLPTTTTATTAKS